MGTQFRKGRFFLSAFFRRLSRVLSPAIRNYQRHSMKGIRLMRGNFAGLSMLYGMFTVWNPWIFFDDSLLRLGLSWKEWGILLLSIYVLWQVDIHQERLCIRDKILEQPLVIRWGIYLGAIAVIWVFGTYGFGFDAKAFIYGGF